MDLETALENVLFALDRALESIAQSDQDSLGGYSYVFACGAYRKAACLRLQAFADVPQFADLLIASATLWATFRESVADNSGYEEECLAGSKFNPFFDALAAGSPEVAGRIAKSFPAQIQPEWEYEEDYLFYKFACHYFLAQTGHPSDDLEELLGQWESVSDGGMTPYQAVCRALVAADHEDFFDSLRSIVDEREAAFDAWRESPSYLPEVEHASRYIYVNGLGLLKLAELAGLAPAPPLPTMPDIARLPTRP